MVSCTGTWWAVELRGGWGRRDGAVSDHFLEGLRIYSCEAVGEDGWWWGGPAGGEVGWWVDVWWEVGEAFRWGLVVARSAVRRHS